MQLKQKYKSGYFKSVFFAGRWQKKKKPEKSHWLAATEWDGETDDIGFALQLQNSSSSSPSLYDHHHQVKLNR